MGLFNKIKEALFDDVEEETSVPTNTKVETRVTNDDAFQDYSAKELTRETNDAPKEVRIERDTEIARPVKPTNNIDNLNDVSERKLYNSNDSFPFFDFDEEEFSSMSRQTRQNNNVLEYEKKKKLEKKYDLGKYERIETKELVEKKKFKPSPIISPVYGILNEDYRIEDIQDKTEENREKNNLDFNAVRKKAFENVKKDKEVAEPETFYQETVTVKLKENDNVREQKSKTIDELLEDTADVTIDTSTSKKNIEETNKSYEDIDDDLEELLDVKEEPKKEAKEEFENEDTLESDLFDLIDSMYDGEDGE